MIPILIQELIDKQDIPSLYKIIDTSKNQIEIAWAELGVAECWRLGGSNYRSNKQTAYDLFNRIVNKTVILPPELIILTRLGKADCFRVADDTFEQNFQHAYKIYTDLIKIITLPGEIQWRVLCGIADCLRTDLIYKPGHLKKAYTLFDEVLQRDHLLPPVIRLRALYGKAECLRRGDIDFPPQPKKACEILCGLESQTVVPTFMPWIHYNLAECLLMEEDDYIGDTQKSLQLCRGLLKDGKLDFSLIALVKDCMNRGLSRNEKESKREKRPAVISSFSTIQGKLNEGVDSVEQPKPGVPILSDTSTKPPVKEPKLKPQAAIYTSDDYDEPSKRSPKQKKLPSKQANLPTEKAKYTPEEATPSPVN
jgi:hypothetical protein